MQESEGNIEERILARIQQWSPPFSEDIDASRSSVMRRIQEKPDTKNGNRVIKKQNKGIFAPQKLRIAATILALIALAGIGYMIGGKTISNASEVSQVVTLPDGSEVMLAPDAGLSYNRLIWPLSRSLEFKGEAFFSVLSGSKFVVKTQQGNVWVMGTRFTVWTGKNNLLVHCSNGRVEVSNQSDTVQLNANEFTCVEKGHLTLPTVYKADGFIAPRKSNLLNFQEVPVGIVVSELEKAFGIEIENELPVNLIYTGILDIRNMNQTLEVFCKPFGAEYTVDANGLVMIHL